MASMTGLLQPDEELPAVILVLFREGGRFAASLGQLSLKEELEEGPAAVLVPLQEDRRFAASLTELSLKVELLGAAVLVLLREEEKFSVSMTVASPLQERPATVKRAASTAQAEAALESSRLCPPSSDDSFSVMACCQHDLLGCLRDPSTLAEDFCRKRHIIK